VFYGMMRRPSKFHKTGRFLFKIDILLLIVDGEFVLFQNSASDAAIDVDISKCARFSHGYTRRDVRQF